MIFELDPKEFAVAAWAPLQIFPVKSESTGHSRVHLSPCCTFILHLPVMDGGFSSFQVFLVINQTFSWSGAADTATFLQLSSDIKRSDSGSPQKGASWCFDWWVSIWQQYLHCKGLCFIEMPQAKISTMKALKWQIKYSLYWHGSFGTYQLLLVKKKPKQTKQPLHTKLVHFYKIHVNGCKDFQFILVLNRLFYVPNIFLMAEITFFFFSSLWFCSTSIFLETTSKYARILEAKLCKPQMQLWIELGAGRIFPHVVCVVCISAFGAKLHITHRNSSALSLTLGRWDWAGLGAQMWKMKIHLFCSVQLYFSSHFFGFYILFQKEYIYNANRG